MGHEIEIGFFIEEKESYEKAIKKLGFVETSTVIQTDMMFDTLNAELWLKKDSKIRIRVENDIATLTYKGAPFVVTDYAERVEVNIEINNNAVDDYKTLFATMGYPLLFQLQKQRIIYEKDNIQIVFDNYPILGWRVEIEGEKDVIQSLSEFLFPGRKYVFRYLSQYFTDHMNKVGKSIEQLKQEYMDETGFDIGYIEKIFDYE